MSVPPSLRPEPWQHPMPGPADPALDDRALVHAVSSGDRRALELLYRRNVGWLTVRLQRRCNDAELVDSALQDTFVAVWRNSTSYRGDGDVGAWLWGIAIRRLVDQQRKRRPVPVDAGDAAVPHADEPASPSAETAALDTTLLGGDIADAMAALTPELQQALLVTAVDGLTTAEAADLLGIPQGTVKTRLMRARAILQERMR